MPTPDERARERRFTVRLVAATVALQLAGGALAAVLLVRRGHVGGAPPMPVLPIQGGALDVRSK